MVFASSASLLLRYIFKRENARRNALAETAVEARPIDVGVAGGHPEKTALDVESGSGEQGTKLVGVVGSVGEYEDLTDKQRLAFRYTY